MNLPVSSSCCVLIYVFVVVFGALNLGLHAKPVLIEALLVFELRISFGCEISSVAVREFVCVNGH